MPAERAMQGSSECPSAYPRHPQRTRNAPSIVPSVVRTPPAVSRTLLGPHSVLDPQVLTPELVEPFTEASLASGASTAQGHSASHSTVPGATPSSRRPLCARLCCLRARAGSSFTASTLSSSGDTSENLEHDLCASVSLLPSLCRQAGRRADCVLRLSMGVSSSRWSVAICAPWQ